MRIDALRGLAILAVVLGHVIFVVNSHTSPLPGTVWVYGAWVDRSALLDPVYNVITTVNMPLFAFVSGYLLGLRPPVSARRMIARRAWTLMVPWTAWIVLGLLLRFTTPLAFIRQLGADLLDPEASGLWFLYALFECYLVYVTVRVVSKRDWALVLVAGVFAATTLLQLPNILGIVNVALLFPFFVMGVLGATRSWWRSGIAVAASALVYAATFALRWPATYSPPQWWAPGVRDALHGIGLTGKVTNVWMLSAVYQSARYVCGAAGIVLLFALYSRAGDWFLTAQAWVGRRSLGVYVTHYGIILALVAAGLKGELPVFVAVVAVAIGETLVIERIPGVRAVFLGQLPPRRVETPPAAPATPDA